MRLNKYFGLIISLITLLSGCNSSFTENEIEIVRLINKIAEKECKHLTERSIVNADKFSSSIIENGERPREVRMQKGFNIIWRKSNQAMRLLNSINKDSLPSQSLEQHINMVADSLNIIQLIFKHNSEENIFNNFFLYPDSNRLFKRYKPLSFYSAYYNYSPKELSSLNTNMLKLSLLSSRLAIIHYFASQISDGGDYFDRIDVCIVPKSTIVDNGSTYEADISLCAYSTVTHFIFMYNGKKLKRPGGYSSEYHYLEFPVPKPDHYDSNGLSKQQWTAQVISDRKKSDTLTITRDYYIRKPCTK